MEEEEEPYEKQVIVDIEMHVVCYTFRMDIVMKFLLYITWAIRYVWVSEAFYLRERLCEWLCVWVLCKYVNIQTSVAVVHFAHIYALATTICCSFFFSERTLQSTNYFIENKRMQQPEATPRYSLSFFYLNLFECSIIFLLAIPTIMFMDQRNTNITKVTKVMIYNIWFIC